MRLVESVRQKGAEGAKSGEPDYSIVFAGAGVGEMHEVKDPQVRQATCSPELYDVSHAWAFSRLSARSSMMRW